MTGTPRTAPNRSPHRRWTGLTIGAVMWLLLASEISSEENAPGLAQILGITAWSLLGALAAGWLLRWLLLLTARAGARAIRLVTTRWAR